MTVKLETPIKFVMTFWKGYSKMKNFLIAVAVVCIMGASPLMADDDGHKKRDHGKRVHNDRHHHRHHHHRHRGFGFNYYTPGDMLGGIGNYAVGVTARIGNGVYGIAAAPFTTGLMMPAPRRYVFHAPRIEYRRHHRHWHFHRH